ncbi:hypothetical protein SISSUDRAFT_1130502 [Sistotremastrum suecicum HHB10207 ss-3]|uniref:RING-CH-type domain-containing protein n=1 Tax=Sistotremastrum suecicum HHB10207 ss-3 TaxID=1314776 RepID=A0A166BCL8_9AGAM|nr:hypothetical protein SISSUDRAFT_1130502 [Sistotremastrum suecicum HHB10207 ss-3]
MPEPVLKWNLSRPPTIDDLRSLECFVCREEETRDPSASTSHDTTAVTRKWVHPCSCSLVAHESCLLHWIARAPQNVSSATPVPVNRSAASRCPQCRTKYVIESENPLILKVMEWTDGICNRLGRVVTVSSIVGLGVGAGSGLYALFTIYGEHAAQMFLGTEAYQLLLSTNYNKWPWHAYINVPLIPVLLLLSRSESMNTTLNSLYLIPLSLSANLGAPAMIAPGGVAGNLAQGIETGDLDWLFDWPPHPLWIATLLPVIRTLYFAGREQILNKILGTPEKTDFDAPGGAAPQVVLPPPGDIPAGVHPQVANANAAAENARRRRRAGVVRRMLWDLEGFHARVDVVQADGARPRPDRAAQARARQAQAQVLAAAGGAVGGNVRVQAAGPVNANGAANAAQENANPEGDADPNAEEEIHVHVVDVVDGHGADHEDLQAGEAAADAEDINTIRVTGNSLGRLIGGALIMPTVARIAGALLYRIARRLPGGFLARFLGLHGRPYPPGFGIRSLDPVYWRNTVGLGLWLVATDCASLLHLYLRKRELQSRRIQSRSFAGMDLDSLDLVVPSS